MDNTTTTKDKDEIVLKEERKKEEWYNGFSQYVNACQLRGKVKESMTTATE